MANVRPVAAPQAAAAVNDGDPNVARTPEITLRFDASRCIHSRHCVLGAPSVFLANVQGPWLHPESVSVERCSEIAHACPSGAITYHRHDGGPQETPPAVNVLTIRENGPYAVHAEIELSDQAPMFRVTLCRCGKSANKPFCDNSHRAGGFIASGEPQAVRLRPARRPRRRARYNTTGGRTAAGHRQPGDLLRDRSHAESGRKHAPLPVRRVGRQALLRRVSRPRGLPLGDRTRRDLRRPPDGLRRRGD